MLLTETSRKSQKRTKNLRFIQPEILKTFLKILIQILQLKICNRILTHLKKWMKNQNNCKIRTKTNLKSLGNPRWSKINAKQGLFFNVSNPWKNMNFAVKEQDSLSNFVVILSIKVKLWKTINGKFWIIKLNARLLK